MKGKIFYFVPRCGQIVNFSNSRKKIRHICKNSEMKILHFIRYDKFYSMKQINTNAEAISSPKFFWQAKIKFWLAKKKFGWPKTSKSYTKMKVQKILASQIFFGRTKIFLVEQMALALEVK